MFQQTMFGLKVEELRPAAEREIVPLDFETHPVRMILVEGTPWWVLTDVAKPLGYRDATDAGRILRDKHKGTPTTHRMRSSGLRADTILVNEAGLYRLMMRSNKPEAERFQDWITEEVLPSIRRTGSYSVRPTGRIASVAKRMKSDMMTAKARCETIDINKHSNKRLASEGATPRDFAVFHNGRYRGLFDGMTAKDLREQASLKDYQTPLDHMGGLLLTQSHHAVWVAERKIKDLQADGKPISIEEQAQILEDTARCIAAADFEKLGTGYVYGLVDDPQRGLVFDVIRAQISE